MQSTVIEYLDYLEITPENLDKAFETLAQDREINELTRGVTGSLAYYKRQLVLVCVEKTLLSLQKKLCQNK